MKRETVSEAATVEEAIDAALEELGVQPDAVEYEIMEAAPKRLFGRASDKQARVRVWLTDAFIAELERSKSEGDEPEQILVDDQTIVLGAAAEPLTDEELDKVADEASSAVKNILSGFGIEPKVEEYEGDYGEIILDIDGEDLGILIGRHGRTLDALQVLVSAITNRRVEKRHPVLIDISGYRYRRKAKIEEIARRAAERVKRQGRPVELRPMSAYERKVVHMALRDDKRVKTGSEGDEPNRQVVVSPR